MIKGKNESSYKRLCSLLEAWLYRWMDVVLLDRNIDPDVNTTCIECTDIYQGCKMNPNK